LTKHDAWETTMRSFADKKYEAASPDYSEEAIPERDPTYRLPAGTCCQTRTIEHLPAAERLALARRLEQLGMSSARALLVASL
jgi:hypothetical protein